MNGRGGIGSVRGRRFLTAWLGLHALLLQLLLPVFHHPDHVYASPGALAAALAASADAGSLPTAHHPGDSGEHQQAPSCPLCLSIQHAQAFLAPTAPALLLPATRGESGRACARTSNRTLDQSRRPRPRPAARLKTRLSHNSSSENNFMISRAFRAGRSAARSFLSGHAPLLVVALLLASPAAFAHAHLQSAIPPADATVDKSPAAVILTFTEALEARFSSIEVKDAAGKRVDDGKPHSEGGDAKRLSVGVAKLAPGVYTVDWHATSVDTHRTEGSFHFTVK
jgi:methionine-rich copper-binding protein CopC